jgi:lipoate-protein ligase A
MRVSTVISFEDLLSELERMKRRGEEAFIGLCCQPFYAKHVEDFKRSGVPGILLDIDDTTCYDLDQAKEAYAGVFESQTTLDLPLLESVLALEDSLDEPAEEPRS